MRYNFIKYLLILPILYIFVTSNYFIILSIKIINSAYRLNLTTTQVHNNFPQQITLENAASKINDINWYSNKVTIQFNPIKQWISKPIIAHIIMQQPIIKYNKNSIQLSKKLQITPIANQGYKVNIFNNDYINYFTIAAKNNNWQLHLTQQPINIKNEYLTLKAVTNCSINNKNNQINGKCILNGELNNNKFTLQALLNKNTTINFHSKANTLTALINAENKIKLKLNIKNLNQLFPYLSGTITGVGEINNKNQLNGNYLANNLQINQTTIAKTQLAINDNIININLSNLNFNGFKVNQIKSVLKITPNKKQIFINKLSTTTTNQTNWQTIQPIALTWQDVQNWHIPKTCLNNNNQAFCLEANNQNTSTYIKIIVNNLSAKIINSILPINSGIINGTVALKHLKKWHHNINLHLKKASLIIPKLGQKVNNINGSITNNNSNLTRILAQGNINNQPLKLTANLTADMHGNINLLGNNIVLYKSPVLTLNGSPNLTVDLAEKSFIKGTIAFSNIKFNPSKITSSLPNNTIIINKNYKSNYSLNLPGKIKLTIPKPIKTNIYGVTGNLAGNIDLQITQNNNYIANGTLQVQNPSHHLLKEIKIKTAKITYNQSPITEPYINIDISRALSESWQNSNPFAIAMVTVGVKIYGSILSPYYHYYSNPIEMEKNQIISSLVSGFKTNTILPYQAILFSIGISNENNSFANVLQPNLPFFDSIQFISNDDLNHPLNTRENEDTSLLMVKNISPKLSINYQFSLIENVSKFALNSQIKSNTYSQIYSSNNSLGINIIRLWK